MSELVRDVWRSVLSEWNSRESERDRLRRVGVDVHGIGRSRLLMLLLLLNRRRLRSMRRPLVEVLEGSRSTEVLLLTREGRFVSMRRSVVEVSVEGSRSTSSSVVPLLLLRVERFRLTRRRLRLRLRSVVIGGVVGSRLDGYGVGGGTDGRRRWIRASRENGVGHGSR